MNFGSREDLPFSAATERNKAPILEALNPRMPGSGTLLEIGAGTGQHAVFLAAAFPGIMWLPTDRAVELPGLMARLGDEGGGNVLPARALDVLVDAWPPGTFDVAFSANTSHIMPWQAVEATFAGLGQCLAPGGPYFLYGPFNRDGAFTAPSNQAFDASLRARDPAMGLRDMAVLESLAARHQMNQEECIAMPANNFLLVFRKQRVRQE